MPRLRSKLPVPGPWQDAVENAVGDLVQRLEVAPHEVAVTRVVEAEWDEAMAGGTKIGHTSGLDVWLLCRGETHRYHVALKGVTPTERPLAGAPPEGP